MEEVVVIYESAGGAAPFCKQNNKYVPLQGL